MRSMRIYLALLATFFCLATSHCVYAQLSTADHLADPGFWPTQNTAPRNEYVGADACAGCHAAKAASQKTTQMARTAMHADDSAILHAHPKMTFEANHYRYLIATSSGSTCTINGSAQTLSAPLLWAFGTGDVGQSYLFKKNDGNFYEARVTYFETLNDLNFTPGRALTSPKDIDEAMYRPVHADEVVRCFACHTTASSVGDKFDEKNLILGVTCEACHGAGVKHVASAQAAKVAGMPEAARENIFNPAQLDPVDSVDFCGACHGTFWDVRLSGTKGVNTAKSQPYRLEGSKCWGKGDSRFTCVACHDPHEPLQRTASAYDGACLNCHAATAATKKANQQAACPVATKDCVTCHMPKVFVPEMHYNFTDHRIRIVRTGDAFPE